MRHASLPALAIVVTLVGTPVFAQTQPQAPPAAPPALRPPTRADILRGEYGRFRANNDLLSYHLNVRVDPEKKFISGANAVRFRMLKDDRRIQLDLYANLSVDRILLGTIPLQYERDINAVFIDFPETLKAGREYTIDFHYSGAPRETGRFGGLAFRTDPTGRHWINTANEGEGSSIWWPSKDQWRDEPENMKISVAIPNDLVDVSNGRFLGKTDLGDGYTRWDWQVHYPINSYNVSLNIGNYVHFSDRLPSAAGGEDLTLDFYVLPASLEKARQQFAQAKPMIQAYEKFFGEYPFPKDGYKLIEVPYSGMEHQSAVTYGNRFANGYLERDWTGVGVSLKFDFIIIHESAHEWFGNAVSAADVSDMWIQEGWTTYLENLYVEEMFGYDAALKYVNGYKPKVVNRQPIVTQRGIHRTPPGDQYFKGALFLNTLRSVVDDDEKWWRAIRAFYQEFKYRNIMTEDVVRFFNARLGQDLTPIFDQYLRRVDIPTLELAFDEKAGTVAYRWNADERAFAMPVKVGAPARWRTITPTTDWQIMRAASSPAEFEVATDLYYVNVARRVMTSTTPARTKAFRFGRLWDGARILSDAVVTVEGDRIVGVASGTASLPAGTELVDLRPYVAIPGLIDLHTHMTYYWDREPGTRPLGQRRRPAVTVFLAQENAKRTLETGVTTVRDLGASNETDFAMRDLIQAGAMTGPRMFVSGQGISASRAATAPDPAVMRRTTEERVKAGADWIKVYASRGSFDSVDTTQTVTFDEMKAIVEAAHAAGRKVAIHSYGPSGVKDAVRAGADSVEHGVDLDDETLAAMAARGTVWVPTIDHNRYYVDARDEYGFAPEAIGPLQDYIQRNLESARRAVKAGVRIGMGSDAVFSMFGQNTRELGWFVKAGMTPEQALASATTIPAALLERQDRLGRVAPGYLADIVAIDGDPLASIDALFTGVRWVMKDGAVVVDRTVRR